MKYLCCWEPSLLNFRKLVKLNLDGESDSFHAQRHEGHVVAGALLRVIAILALVAHGTRRLGLDLDLHLDLVELLLSGCFPRCFNMARITLFRSLVCKFVSCVVETVRRRHFGAKQPRCGVHLCEAKLVFFEEPRWVYDSLGHLVCHHALLQLFLPLPERLKLQKLCVSCI